VQLVAHRGNAREYPENTLPAFRSALELGARYLELDVQLSADAVPVVIHDATLARTTGRRGRVRDLTAAELAGVEAAEPRRFGDAHRGTTLPRLTDALRLLDGRPDVTLFVEIKRESLVDAGLDRTVAAVVDACAPWRRQCVAISFDLEAVVRARALGAAAIGWVLGRPDERSRRRAEDVRPDFLFVDVRRIGRRTTLWPGRWRWVVYEVDDPAVAHRLATLGVEFIETMAVAPMLRALDARPSPP